MVLKEEFKERKIEVLYTTGDESADFFEINSDDYQFSYQSNQEFSSIMAGEDQEKRDKIRIELYKIEDAIRNIHDIFFDK